MSAHFAFNPSCGAGGGGRLDPSMTFPMTITIIYPSVSLLHSMALPVNAADPTDTPHALDTLSYMAYLHQLAAREMNRLNAMGYAI